MRATILSLIALLTAAFASGARAQLSTLHAFTGSDGSNPTAGLVRGNDGNFYGTTAGGGDNGNGTVFRLAPGGALTVLHSFGDAADDGTNADGATPAAALVGDDSGNFYGTTQGGGASAFGTVFRLGADGSFTTLYSFKTTDGNNPVSALVRGTDGNLYGTTLNGGTNDAGTVYQITTGGALTTLASLSTAGGDAPSGALVAGNDGNFYGTTRYGGSNGLGTIFRVSTSGALTTIFSFDAGSGTNPTGALVKGPDGAFYGAAPSNGNNGRGTVFRVTQDGAFNVLHAFTPDDLASSPGAVAFGPDGNLYGTANNGGSKGRGAIFRLTTGGMFTNLYNFTGGNDGGYPQAAPTPGADGNFYGTTSGGGANRAGTVYALPTGMHPAFFSGEVALGNSIYYLAFPNGNVFGYYAYLSDPRYVYHFDLGFEYVFDAGDGRGSVYLYDFKSGDFFYTSPVFPFPYLYDFSLNAVLYYYPDPNNAGHYNTNGVRYFYNFATGQIITR